MELTATAFLAYLNAAIVSMLAAAILGLRFKTLKISTSFVVAGVLQAAWLLSISLLYLDSQINISVVALAELGYHAGWIFCLSRQRPNYAGGIFDTLFLLIALISVFACFTMQSLLLFGVAVYEQLTLYRVQGLWMSALNLFFLVRCYGYFEQTRLARLLILSLTIICVHNILYFSFAINGLFASSSLNEIRALIILIASIFIAHCVATFGPKDKPHSFFSFPLPILFYSACLICFVLMLLGISYMGETKWQWGGIVYSLLMTFTISALLILFGSSGLRGKAKVNIRKRFFKHKYDYRQEWLNLLDELSGSNRNKFVDVYGHVLNIVINIFSAYSGALWLKRGNFFVPVKTHRIHLDLAEYFEQEDTHFCHILCAKEWVFLAQDAETDPAFKRLSSYLPDWVENIDNFWLIMPLISERELVGFIALTRNSQRRLLDWEDLDLFKAVGRQIASHIRLQEQTELLTETRQLETFNKLSTFVMHDLKNIVAQQSLVVTNADKHKDNPLFFSDTIKTISNSVERMNILLQKLHRQDPEQVSLLNLVEVLQEAVNRCNHRLPAPVLDIQCGLMHLLADRDTLTMIFVHVIQNSQDATPAMGNIFIDVCEEASFAKVVIADDGSGMDEQFVREKLFKPFESTKLGKGMGIGVYQVRDYVHELGGVINVISSVGKGTKFTIILPLA